MSPGLASRCSPGEDLDVHDEPAVERDDESDARAVQVEPADDRRCAALQDPQDAPFRAIVADALDPGDDAIPVHRLVEIAPGDVQMSPLTSSSGRSGTTNPNPRGWVTTRPTTRFIRSGRP